MAIGAIVGGLIGAAGSIIGGNKAKKAAETAAEAAALKPFNVSGPLATAYIDPTSGQVQFAPNATIQNLANQYLQAQQGLFYGQIPSPGAPLQQPVATQPFNLTAPVKPTAPTPMTVEQAMARWEEMNPAPSAGDYRTGSYKDYHNGGLDSKLQDTAAWRKRRENQEIYYKLHPEELASIGQSNYQQQLAAYNQQLATYNKQLQQYNTQQKQAKNTASPSNVTGGPKPNSGGTATGVLGSATNNPAATGSGASTPSPLDISGIFTGLDPRQNAMRDVYGGVAQEIGNYLNFNPEDAAKNEFELRMKLLRPEFQREQNRLDNKLFGRGLLASSGGGIVQRDLYGAQGQLTNQAAVESIASARDERNTLYNQFLSALSGQAGLNELNRSLSSGERDLALRSGLFGLSSQALNQYLGLMNIPMDYAQLALQASGAGASAGSNAAPYLAQSGLLTGGQIASGATALGNVIANSGIFGSKAPGTASNFSNYGQQFGMFG